MDCAVFDGVRRTGWRSGFERRCIAVTLSIAMPSHRRPRSSGADRHPEPPKPTALKSCAAFHIFCAGGELRSSRAAARRARRWNRLCRRRCASQPCVLPSRIVPQGEEKARTLCSENMTTPTRHTTQPCPAPRVAPVSTSSTSHNVRMRAFCRSHCRRGRAASSQCSLSRQLLRAGARCQSVSYCGPGCQRRATVLRSRRDDCLHFDEPPEPACGGGAPKSRCACAQQNAF